MMQNSHNDDSFSYRFTEDPVRAMMATSNFNRSSSFQQLQPCNNTILDLQLYIFPSTAMDFWSNTAIYFKMNFFFYTVQIGLWLTRELMPDFSLFCNWLM